MGRVLVATLATALIPCASTAQADLREKALEALADSTRFFRDTVARHGGYQYLYSEDLQQTHGEIRRGAETAVTVQPPATPSVGLVFLQAYEATGDRVHLDAALRAAQCLLEGQLRSGGWGYGVEYDEELRRTHAYRVEARRPDQNDVTVLDDDTTQAALRFLMHLDAVLQFENEAVHEAVEYALASVLAAQYPNGAWPQRYEGPSDPDRPVKKATYPAEWTRTWPGPDYKSHYTFNDNSIVDTIRTLFEATKVYGDGRFEAAARKGADFILLAQLPEPQPAWAQQYDGDMHPVWARRFEPPAVSGRESQDILLALLDIYRHTGEAKYLEPVPAALAYLGSSRLPDGQIARFHELQTRRPLYFTQDYVLTYDDGDLPTHYAFKVADRLGDIESQYEALRAHGPDASGAGRSAEDLHHLVREAIATLDDQGRWLEAGTIPRYPPRPDSRIIRSATFVRNAGALSEYLATAAP